MAKEIERKFLVIGDCWRNLAHGAQGELICQAYIARGKNCVFRIRTRSEKAMLTIKGKREGISGDEFEYEIPLADAQLLIKNYAESRIIEKLRYLISYEGYVWEVDEFMGDNQGLIVAEIELSDKNESFSVPEWVGTEVSYDEKYTNFCLSKLPYRDWGKLK